MKTGSTSDILLDNGLLLRTLETSNAESYYHLYKTAYESKEDSPFQPGETPADFTSRILGLCTHIWTIRLADDPETIVGDAALHDWNKETSTIEIGGTLLPAYQGKGIMVPVFNFIIAFAKAQLNITTIIGRTGSNNQQAIRMILKLKFIKLSEMDGAAVFQKLL